MKTGTVKTVVAVLLGAALKVNRDAATLCNAHNRSIVNLLEKFDEPNAGLRFFLHSSHLCDSDDRDFLL